MKHQLAAVAFAAALAIPQVAIAKDFSLAPAFVNPIPQTTPVDSTRSTMIIMRTFDAFNSAYHAQHAVTGYRWNEDDRVMKSFSHEGVLGYATGFALQDFALHSIVRIFHLGPRAHHVVDVYQAGSSLHGIMFTEAHSK